MIDPSAAALADRLRWRLVAAAATPAAADGSVDPDVVARYLRGLVADGAGALAVLAHTGRGPYQTDRVADVVVRLAVATGVPVIVGVGGQPGESTARVAARAAAAATAGADGLLVFPPDTAPPVAHGDAAPVADGDAELVDRGGADPVAYHDAIWRASGLPLLGFDLYQRPYPAPVRDALLEHPGVAGLKVARLSDAVACQEAIAATRRAGRLAVTGEDRMFGPSLMWGAQAALVGIAAAAVPVTAAVLAAYHEGRYADFVATSARLDRLAGATFTEPMEGYVQRMLWIAAAEGRVPERYATDPYAPPLPPGERERVLEVLR